MPKRYQKKSRRHGGANLSETKTGLEILKDKLNSSEDTKELVEPLKLDKFINKTANKEDHTETVSKITEKIGETPEGELKEAMKKALEELNNYTPFVGGYRKKSRKMKKRKSRRRKTRQR
jgi:hypothetical protein